MFWQEDEDRTADRIPDDITDVLFALDCRSISVDHAHALSRALLERAPWLQNTDCGIHTIHVAGSQNGWERPQHGGGEQLQLSRRTKLCVRIPKARIADLKAALEGQTVDVGGAALRIGRGKQRSLTHTSTLFSRYVAGPAGEDEDAFLQWAAGELAALGVKVRKALCGKRTPLATPAGAIDTRSLMLADLTADESMLLQQHGLGPRREMGCGIFIPHKGIDAVHQTK
jgi:CRISPR-associated protein Cas6